MTQLMCLRKNGRVNKVLELNFFKTVMNIQNRSLLCSVMLAVVASAEAVPKELLDGLSSEEFKRREASQVEAEKWVNEKGSAGVAAIYQLYVGADDPEVRTRCLRILRTQSEKEYMNDGKGYLGVQLSEENLEIAGEDKPRIGVRVNYVMPGSQAEIAGIKAGDIIASMDGKKWHQQGAINELIETVASYKPLRKVVFEIKKQGEEKLSEVPVILGKRPVDNLREMYSYQLEDLEKKARDRHFEEWLKKQKVE